MAQITQKKHFYATGILFVFSIRLAPVNLTLFSHVEFSRYAIVDTQEIILCAVRLRLLHSSFDNNYKYTEHKWYKHGFVHTAYTQL